MLISNWIRSAVFCSLAVVLAVQAGCSTLNLKTPQIFKRQTARNTEQPRPPKITSENAAQVQLAMARSLERKGNLAKAAEAYQRIIDDHDSTTAYHRLAIVRDQQGNFEASRDLFAEALDREPENAELLCDIGYSAYLQGNNEESAEALEAAIRLQPDMQRAHNNLALLHARQQQYDAAVKEFAIASNSYGQAHLNLAYALAVHGRLPLAKKHAQRALEIDSQSEKAKSLVGELERLESKQLANNKSGETPEDRAQVAMASVSELDEMIAQESASMPQASAESDAVVEAGTQPQAAEELNAEEEPPVIRTASVFLGEPILQHEGGVLLQVTDQDPALPPTSELRFVAPR